MSFLDEIKSFLSNEEEKSGNDDSSGLVCGHCGSPMNDLDEDRLICSGCGFIEEK